VPVARPYQPWVSWARLAGIAAVVLIHVSSSLVNTWPGHATAAWQAGNVAMSVARWSVPLFIVASGATVLAPRAETMRDFYTRRFVRIGIPLLFWTAFFVWFNAATSGRTPTPKSFLHGYLSGQPYFHMYFLYVVAGLAVVTPFLRLFVAAVPTRVVAAAAGVLLALACLQKMQQDLYTLGAANAFNLFVPYLGYYLLGHLLAVTTDRPTPRQRSGAAAVWVAAMAATAAGTWAMYTYVGFAKGRVLYDYFAPTTIVATVALSLWLRPIGARERATASSASSHPWPRRLSDLTLGIYLLHPVVLVGWRHLVAAPALDAGTAAVLGYHLASWLVVLAATTVAVAGLRQVPAVRALV